MSIDTSGRMLVCVIKHTLVYVGNVHLRVTRANVARVVNTEIIFHSQVTSLCTKGAVCHQTGHSLTINHAIFFRNVLS